jgi:hypothetical protein
MKVGHAFQSFTMAALEAATQLASVSERKDSFARRVDTRLLGSRVKPGHGEVVWLTA